MAIVDRTSYLKSVTTQLPIDAVTVAGQGGGILEIVAKVPILATDDADSIYRFCEVPSNFIPVGGEITCSAITGMSSVSLGIYENPENGGTLIDATALTSAQDFSSALAPGAGLSPIANVAIANQNAALYTLAGDVSGERQTYTLAFKTNADPAANGTIIVRLRLVRREYAAA